VGDVTYPGSDVPELHLDQVDVDQVATEMTRRRGWRLFWAILGGLLIAMLGLGGGFAAAAWHTAVVPPNLDSVYAQTTTIYYSDGVTEIGTIAQQRREIVDFDTLPAYVGNAVVASEDASFWTNLGVDPRGILRAMWVNLRGGNLLSGQGASTITMQFIERYYTDTVTTVPGKIQEALKAIKITQEKPKEEILGGYLNTIFWGRGSFGIEAASQAYFGHPASELTISEAALLAGVIPAPNLWDPAINLEQAQSRWQRTLNLMVANDFITQAEADAAVFPDTIERPDWTGGNAGQAGYLMQEVRRELARTGQFGENAEQIETRGLRIITTIDKDLQDRAVEIAAEIPRTGDAAASPNLDMSLVAEDPTNGEIKALYGGADYQTRQFNTATDGRAQAGSTFKPFTLISALENGFELSDWFDGDSPMNFPEYDWQPSNFGNQSFGRINLVRATADSVNTVYAQLNIDNGPERTAEMAHRLGIPDEPEGSPGYINPYPANVLGTASIRPVDLTAAYATIANDGIRTTPHIVREVTDLAGNPLYFGPTDRERVVSEDVIAAATYALQQVVLEGSGEAAQALRGPDGEPRPSAGKTGTSQNNISAWYAGFVPQLVTVVSLHQDSPDGGEEPITPFGEWVNNQWGMTGSTFPVTAWTQFMQTALEGVPVEQFPDFEMPEPCIPGLDPDCQDGEWVMIPDLTGTEYSEAVSILHSFGLNVVSVHIPGWQPEGFVESVEGAGEIVARGSTVTVNISTGGGGWGNEWGDGSGDEGEWGDWGTGGGDYGGGNQGGDQGGGGAGGGDYGGGDEGGDGGLVDPGFGFDGNEGSISD